MTRIGGDIEPDLGDVSAVWILGRQSAEEMARQVLIEEQPHAGAASRGSRSAANSSAART